MFTFSSNSIIHTKSVYVPGTDVWPDAYLAALASSAGLAVATMGKGFRRMSGVDIFYLPI